jgi:hypothetical protein
MATGLLTFEFRVGVFDFQIESIPEAQADQLLDLSLEKDSETRPKGGAHSQLAGTSVYLE